MSDAFRVRVSAADVGRRADVVVAAHLEGHSRSSLHDMFQGGLITVDGAPIKPSQRLREGDDVEVQIVARPAPSARPEAIPLTIVYRDDDLAVIDKPAGLVVHPSAGHESGTLVNALMHHLPQVGRTGPELRPGIVHRLDKDTSGLMVVALNGPTLRHLQAQIASRSASRKYLALAVGRVAPERGTIDVPIGRHRADRKRMGAHGIAARPAQTSYQVLEYLDGFTYLEATLHTGRTHQIRVHLAATGHPVAGDAVYGGGPTRGLSRQFLHAYRLSLTSPSTGERLELRSSLPVDLHGFLDGLRDDGAEG